MEGRLSVFKNRNFTLLWVGSIISNAGSWMQMVAQGWLVFELSGSPFLLGVVGVSRAIPMILLAPFGGVVADRLMRIRLLKITQSLSALIGLAPALLTSAGVIEIWHLVLLGVLGAAVNAFDQPTRQALLPDLVKREDLGKAIALNSSAWQGAALFGPALAGVTVATIGISGAFYVNAGSFLAVVGALFLMQGVPERSVSQGRRLSVTGDLFAGLRYVRGSSFVRGLLALSSITSIFGRSYQQLLPVFAADVLHHGTAGYGFLLAAPGAGTVVATLGLAVMKDVGRKGLAFILGMLLFSGTLVLFALNRSFPVGLVLLFISGIVSLLFSTMQSTMLQLEVPGAMRGRVMALTTVTFQGFQPLGALLTGALATAIGTPEAVAASAAVVAVSAVVTYLCAPAIRNYREQDEPMDEPATTRPLGGEVPRAVAPGPVPLEAGDV